MLGITKTFGSLVANNKIDLVVDRNTIHGIIGENGAGKSTLMSILFGLYKADQGIIKINDDEVRIRSPHDASRIGIGMVHQHFKLVGIYNAVDNIILGNELVKFGFLNRRLAKQKIANLAKQYGFEVDLKKPVHKLSVGQQQKIEILKTLFLGANILIFDEPTAVLTPQEIVGFLDLLRQFRAEGKTVILITHKLEEIKAVCEHATVLRHGQVVERVTVSKTSVHHLAKLMVGSDVREAKNNYQAPLGEPALTVEKITSRKLKAVSFKVHSGEIVAIAGVEGNGQSELVEIVTGLSKATHGKLLFHYAKKTSTVKSWVARQLRPFQKKSLVNVAQDFSHKPNYTSNLRHKSINYRNKLGIAHIPEDRQKHGLVLDMKLKYAVAIKRIDEFSWLGLINERQIRKHAQSIIAKYDVRGANYGEALGRQLSGGNQQKAIIGRELESEHSLIVVVQPTRGLDVGAIVHVHEQLLAEKAKGRAVLLVSYDLSEVMSLADRILVLSGGSIVGQVIAKGASREAIGLMMAGVGSIKDKSVTEGLNA